MQNNQTAKITFTAHELEHLLALLKNHLNEIGPFTDFVASSAFLSGRLVHHLEKLQPDGVGRSLGQPSGVVDQVITPHDSKCTCDECCCMGFGFGSGPNEGSDFYPFVIGE